MFTLKYKKNEFYLSFCGKTIDRFDLKAIAKSRLRDANEIHRKTVSEGDSLFGHDPVSVYNRTFETKQKLSFVNSQKARQASKNELANSGKSSLGRNPLI